MGLIIPIVIGVVLIAIGIVLLTGRGSFLIAGYNTMPKKKKETYDIKALSRIVGGLVVFIGVLTCLLGVESIGAWYPWVFGAVALGSSICSTVYLNTSSKFRK